MIRPIQIGVAVLSMLCFTAMETASVAVAEGASIGTVSAHGEFRIDNHMVNGNATLFNGSVVETGIATADLRLGQGAAITLSTNSKGTLYADHLILQQGGMQLVAPEAVHLEVAGLHVATNGTKSKGVISIKADNTVEVSAVSGTFDVTSKHGLALASVSPGRAMTFAFQPNADGAAFSGTGKISFSDGHYYLTLRSTGVKYEIKGQDLGRLIGKEADVTGTLQSATSPGSAFDIVDVTSAKRLAAGLFSGTTGAIIGGVIVAASVGTAVGIYEANQSSRPASR